MGPGLMGPERFPIRDVKDGGQINGRIVNPVGYPDMGGFTGPGKWAEGKNDMRVEKPTSVRAAKRTTNGGSGDD